jgi:deoxyribonuclease-4
MTQAEERRPAVAQLDFDDEDEFRPEPEKPVGPPFWQDGSVRVGIHTSIAGAISGALEHASKLGCNALQIFSASPRMWPVGGSTLVPEAVAVEFRARREALRLGPLVIHDNYLINLCSPDRVIRVRSIQTFHDDIVRALALGADFLVAHPGSPLGADRRRAMSEVAQGIRQAARGMKLGRLRILLENTSGMGSALGWRFEELKTILADCRDLPMGVCVDTAHAFEAGYPIHTAEGLEKTLQILESTVGLRNVHVLHLNDSKTPFGSRVDRHAGLGRGEIGSDAFRRILNHPLLRGRTFILENPIERPGDDRRNVRTAWDLLGVPPEQAPPVTSGFTTYKKQPAGKAASRRPRSRTRARGTTQARKRRKP